MFAHLADAAPIGAVALNDAAEAEYASQQDLGESVDDAADEAAEVGEMEDYKTTKKKLEGEIKKVEDGLKKQKATAKKGFDAQMKKASKTFAKLYAPSKKGPSPELQSPLGTDGQSGISSMAQWAFASRVEALTRIAHKKIAKLEKQLDENRFAHFSTAVCKEVLKSKVQAIGDIKFKMERESIESKLKQEKAALEKKIAFDRADMQHKVASFKLWERDSSWAADGGMTGPDPDSVRMMTEGAAHKMGASRVGELVQAAHWAFARQKVHAFEFYSRNRKKLKEELKKVTKQHDLTLCRTGRKPENPQLKYELNKAKKGLKKELENMPAAAQAKAKEKAAEKKADKAEKKVEAAKKEEKKEEKKAEKPKEEDDSDEDLGEAGPGELDETNLSIPLGEAAMEFHKLIDASGGTEGISERIRMFKDFAENAALEQQNIQKENAGLD